ncbi:MAG TPA: D-glycero-beta-D-manno-heptose-7-phosphate kinase [Burkholderiales bacterium]|nr:D-glycero-beta-D-manno-heptose-7-phosphate kinase [Burkholderiales bacterium]
MKRAARKPRVLIVGDVMLDRYWFGEVGRISPEAPVPVVKVDRTEERPGGAANVARNVAALGAEAILLSVVGPDEAGATLRKLLKTDGVSAQLQTDRGVQTTIKLRVIGRRQQLVRIDFETTPGHEALASKMRDFQRLLPSADAVILSDYGKGGLAHITSMIRLAREARKPVLVDPKGDDYTRYRFASIVTPNRAELREVAGSWKTEADLTRKARGLIKKLRLGALLVTRSEEGMTLYNGRARLHVAAQAREVFDVSGAGDTVIATVAFALGRGESMEAAVELANRAAGIVVGKFGTAVVHPHELFEQR